MNALSVLHRSREIGRIAANAGRRKLTREELTAINEAIDQLQYERFQESNPDPSLWPLSSERRRKADGLALLNFMRHGSLPDQLKPLMRLAQQGTSDGSGGYTIPETVAQEVTNALKFSGGMWAAARHVVTDKGSAFPWPYINDSKKAYKIAESTDMETSAEAVTFGAVDLEGAAKYTSGLIRVSNELLEDSTLFVDAFVEALVDRILRGTNEDLTTGSGTGEPNGVLNAAGYGDTMAGSSITETDISNLFFSVSAYYRNRPDAAFMMHSTTLKHMMEQKDTGAFRFPSLWIDGTVLGVPVVTNEDFPSFSTGGKLVAFGDFSRYVIRTTPQRVKRFRERHAESDQSSFATILRIDGDLVDPNAIKYLRKASTESASVL